MAKEQDNRRVLVQITDEPYTPAAVYSIALVAVGLDPNKWRSIVVAPEGGMLQETLERLDRDDNVEFIPAPGIGSGDPMVDYMRLRKPLKGVKPDVVHTHYGPAAGPARFVGKTAKHAKAIVHSLHDWGYWKPGTEPSDRDLRGERRNAHFTDAYVVPSHRAAQDAVSKGIGQPEQYYLIRSGIRLDDFYEHADKRDEARAMLELDPKDLVIGTVGQLEGQQELAVLIRAISYLDQRSDNRNAYLVLFGSGDVGAKALSVAKEVGVSDNVLVIDPSEVNVSLAAIMPGFDAFVPLSQESGGLRIVAVKAMAAQVPVITPPIEGVLDFAQNFKSVHVVDANDPLDLASGIENALSTPGRRRKLITEGMKVAMEFDEENTATRTEALYLKLLGAEKETTVDITQAGG